MLLAMVENIVLRLCKLLFQVKTTVVSPDNILVWYCFFQWLHSLSCHSVAHLKHNYQIILLLSVNIYIVFFLYIEFELMISNKILIKYKLYCSSFQRVKKAFKTIFALIVRIDRVALRKVEIVLPLSVVISSFLQFLLK